MSLNTTVDESAARLVSAEGNPQVAGYTLVREWPFLDATAADTLFTTLKAVTESAATGIYADGQLYAGVFANAKVVPIAQQDRSVAIRQTNILVSVPTSTFSTFSGLAYKRTDQTKLVHPFTAAGAYDPTIDSEVVTTVEFLYEKIAKSTASIIRAYTVANWESMAPGGYAYAQLTIKERDDNTLDVIVQYDLITTDVLIASHTSTAVGLSGSNGSELTTEVVSELQGSETLTVTPVVGSTIRAVVSRDANGRFNKTLITSADLEQAIDEYDTDLTYEQKVEEQSGKNIPTASMSTYAITTDPPTEGILVKIQKAITSTGLWNAVKTTITAIASSIAIYVKEWHYSLKTQENSGKNLSTATIGTDYVVSAGVAADGGVIVSVDKSKNIDGTWNAVKTTRTAIYVYDSGTYLTRLGTVSWWWGINATASQYNAVVSTAALDATTNNSLFKRLNDYGLIDYTITKSPYNDATGWAESLILNKTRKYMQFETIDNVDKYRVITDMFDIQTRHSGTTAEADIDGYGPASEVKHWWQGGYAAWMHTDRTFGAWTVPGVAAGADVGTITWP